MTRKLVLAVWLLTTLLLDSGTLSWAQSSTAGSDDYVPVHHPQHRNHHHHHHHHHHRQLQSHGRSNNQASLNRTASYSLISGPAVANGGNFHGQQPAPNHHQQQHHPQQNVHHRTTHHVGQAQDTPPQHRRHSTGQQPVANAWRWTVDAGTGASGVTKTGNGGRRPANRMLTRSGVNLYGNTKQNSTRYDIAEDAMISLNRSRNPKRKRENEKSLHNGHRMRSSA